MSLNRNEVNPLGVLGLRRVPFIPKHFSTILVPLLDTRNLEQWINYNLNSRYAIQRKAILDQHNKVVDMLEVGLEDPKDLTMFTLACPYLHKTRG